MRADRRGLQQILINLANNAMKFTAHGSVTLRGECIDDGGRAWVELSVIDTGIGISSEDQTRLFQAFTQVGDAQARRKVEGTGLGLHLCRKLAELMDGHIGVHSEPGRAAASRCGLAREG